MAGLVLSRKVGEDICITVGDVEIVITVASFDGSQVRLRCLAPPQVTIDRREVKKRRQISLPPLDEGDESD